MPNKTNKSSDRSSGPDVHWDGEKFEVSLPVDGNHLDAEWKPALTYVIRIRERDQHGWLIGIKTPLRSVSFLELKPDTEYEMEIRAKNVVGEGDPVTTTFWTTSDGSALA